MNNKYVITISRQFGSGGRAIGHKLADKLGIPFYDKELISIAAKDSGLSPEVFKSVDETAANSLLYSLSMGMYNLGGPLAMGDLPVNDKLYLLQHEIIKDIATKGPCVIVGRCADYVLKDNPHTVNVSQGGNAEMLKSCFAENGLGGVVNNSRGILCAYKKLGGIYYEAARAACVAMKEDLCSVLKL